jgi:hypothetical protein
LRLKAGPFLTGFSIKPLERMTAGEMMRVVRDTLKRNTLGRAAVIRQFGSTNPNALPELW